MTAPEVSILIPVRGAAAFVAGAGSDHGVLLAMRMPVDAGDGAHLPRCLSQWQRP